jgi:uncharacterized protein YdaU (DUF1376 family)
MKIPYIALYPADFIADTYHLGNMEIGIYWRLLLHYYQHRQPLPYDLDTVCRIAYATSPEERKAVEFLLTEFFTVATNGRGQKVWRHHRADKEITEACARHDAAVGKARKAAEARWGKPENAPSDAQAYAQALPEQCQPEPEPEPDPDPDPEKNKKSMSAQPPVSFNDFKREYPRKENMKEAERVWKAKKLDNNPLLANTILEDVKRRKAEHGQWLEGVYPHASTYLRNERWLDEITPPRAGNNGHGPPKTFKQLDREDRERRNAASTEAFLSQFNNGKSASKVITNGRK